ncbi:MAG: hypothetical protein RR659_03655, partial [Bacilli bacterium]
KENIIYSDFFLTLFSVFILFGIALILIQIICCIIEKRSFFLKFMFLNIFYIPFYKSKNKIIPSIVLILNILLLSSFFWIEVDQNNYKKVKSDDSLIEIVYPSTFKKCNFNKNFDFECIDENNNISQMVKNYKYDDIKTEINLVNMVNTYADKLKEKDDSFKKVGISTYKTLRDKEIFSETYEGTINSIKYNYILTSIDYGNNKFLSLAIQVVEAKNYLENKDDFYTVIETIKEVL